MEHTHDRMNKNNSLMPITVQAKGVYIQDNRPSSILQRKANNTGLPNNLKSGIENLSGHSMDDVKVHYNSDKPAQLNAHAYAQGSDIHVGSGQEKHLPHEAWHVVQQKQGRVKPTMQMKGKVNVNDDTGLEKEADIMGAKAISSHDMAPGSSTNTLLEYPSPTTNQPLQRVLTLDNGDFKDVNRIDKLGGNAEGAFIVTDGTGSVVMKIAEDIDSAVMAYNLAKDFGITTPKGRYLSLKAPSGIILIGKVAEWYPALYERIRVASSVTLWSLVDGLPIGEHKGQKPDNKATKKFMDDHTNFEQLGRMLVFDAAILNTDRFKMESSASPNPGNVMIENGKPVAIDQDFASIDKQRDSTPSQQIDDYGEGISTRMQPFFSNAEYLAGAFCKKMYEEGYFMFKNQEPHVRVGIDQGIMVLKNLLNETNPRLENLITWSKTFKPDSDLNVGIIKKYWESLLPE